MYKYFTSKGTKKWFDILPELISSYNNTKHRTIKMTPTEASDSKNDILFKNIYGVENVEELYKIKKHKSKLSTGDLVRKAYKPEKFDKSFYPNWTDRTYTVDTVADEPFKPLYNIIDEDKVKEKQRFYPEEVQKITQNLYRIERILKKRRVNGKEQYFVKWLNYPDSFNSWIEDENLVLLNKSINETFN